MLESGYRDLFNDLVTLNRRINSSKENANTFKRYQLFVFFESGTIYLRLFFQIIKPPLKDDLLFDHY